MRYPVPSVRVVSAFVPIPGFGRDETWYAERGTLFDSLDAPHTLYREEVNGLVLKEIVAGYPTARVAVADNPSKNTLDYHAVQHEKSRWLHRAGKENSDADVLVWIDYGITHQPGVTAEIVNEFLGRVRADDRSTQAVTMPGCWDKQWPIDDQNPCWRFCGSLVICPRYLTFRFHSASIFAAEDRLINDNLVSWEVNTWAAVEHRNTLPIRWYPGDHNSTQFTNYPHT